MMRKTTSTMRQTEGWARAHLTTLNTGWRQVDGTTPVIDQSYYLAEKAEHFHGREWFMRRVQAALEANTEAAEDDELAAFEACSRKILDEFGEVHHNLGLNQKGDRGLCAVGPIKNGEIIFGIPECICYTAAGALKDERIGPFIDAHTAPSKPKCDADGDDDGCEKGKVKGKVKGEAASLLRMPRGDVALAMRVTFDALHM